MEEETVFQKIIKGEIPAEKIYEDEYTFAFLDIRPCNKGHTLVVTKEPFRDIFELTDEVGAHLIKTVIRLAKAVKKGTKSDGLNVFINNGKAADQIVFHLHAHLIPRFKVDEFGKLPRRRYEEGEAAIVGDNIRSEIK